MIDISDGLLADLGHIASASGVLIDLSSDRLSPDAELQAAARLLHPSSSRTARGSKPGPSHALAWVLTGGEDHALAATFPPAGALPPRWKVIGTAREGRGVVVDGQPWSGSAGWDHFRAVLDPPHFASLRAVLAAGGRPPWYPPHFASLRA
jgi:thiamine-monophosphate kinase